MQISRPRLYGRRDPGALPVQRSPRPGRLIALVLASANHFLSGCELQDQGVFYTLLSQHGLIPSLSG